MGKFNPFLYYRKCSKKEKEKGHQSKFNTFLFNNFCNAGTLKSSESTLWDLTLYLQLVKKVCVHMQIN